MEVCVKVFRHLRKTALRIPGTIYRNYFYMLP